MTRPVLYVELERRRRRARRPAVTHDDQRRLLSYRRFVVSVTRRVKEGECRPMVCRRELDGFGKRQVARINFQRG